MIKKFLLVALLTCSTQFVFSQNDKAAEDDTKMIREVITVQVDKSAFAVPTPPPAPAAPDKKGKKKAEEQAPAEEAAPDTSSPMIPAPVSEIVKRAQNWQADNKSTKYTKTNCSSSGNKVNCLVSFPYKTKELNPTDKVEGDLVMDVTIDSKEGKYRYTINNIKHKAKVADASGGDIYGSVPECGSMKLSDLSWKHIRSAAFADAKLVADDLKAKMAQASGDAPKKDDW